MSKKPLSGLSGLVDLDDAPAERIDQTHTLAPQPAEPKPRKRPPVALRKAGFLVHPQALTQFDILRAELAGDDRRNAGPKLIHEAFNLLFAKHGKRIIPPLEF
jgi:hypothetical protein